MPAYFSVISRYLQSANLLAVVPGLNRELSGRLRYQRHLAQAEITREVLERLPQADVDTLADLQ